MTLGDWVNQGMLQVRPGRASRRDIPEHLAHRFVGPSEVRRGKLDDVLDEEPVPKALQSNLTVEGDVLLLVQGTVAAVVDEGGGHLVGPGVHRIRVANAAHLGSHYLALVLAGSWNQRFLAGSSLPRADWRLLEVPLVPSKDQANVYLADVAAKLLQEEAEKLAEATATLRRTMLEALRHGIDLPEDPA